MSLDTYTITFRTRHFSGDVGYSVNLWREGSVRGWRPDRRVTGVLRGPQAVQALLLLRELLEQD